MIKPLILSIDAGTTGISVIAFDEAACIVHRTYNEFAQHYPQPGWVEHDADEIWQVALRLVRETLERVGSDSVAAIGLTNQRETTVLWDRRTGQPVSRAIVWQCRRSESLCRAAIEAGHADLVKQKTGLVIDPYFSATKIQYLLRTNPELRTLARHGHLAFGTIDSWLLWNLTGGKVHATDLTNASRTLLLNIHERKWDEALLDLFEVPPTLLPQVRPSVNTFGQTDAAIAGRPIPICGVAGDQQAALFGQTGFKPNDAKVTYGTGAFLVVNCGEQCPLSRSGLLTTLACGANGLPVYALEGSVFVAGAAVQWLRDGLGIIESAAETEALTRSVPDSGGIIVVPAFAGLGAPYWDSAARGAIFGLTRSTTRAHLVRATLESIAHQVADLLDTLSTEQGIAPRELRVDGKACANDFLMQFQSDILGVAIDRPDNVDTTALGAAFLAGLGCGLWPNTRHLESLRRTERRFEPSVSSETRHSLRTLWLRAVRRTLSHAPCTAESERHGEQR